MKDIEKKVLRLIGENPTNPDVFSDITFIRESINDAIEEVMFLTDSKDKVVMLPLYGNQNFYRIDMENEQFVCVKSVYLPSHDLILEQSSIWSVEKYDYRWLQTRNSPHTYFILGKNYLGIYPCFESDGYRLELRVMTLPKRYTNDDNKLKVKSDFQTALSNYAAGEYFLSRGDAEKALHNFALYGKFTGQYGIKSKIGDRSFSLKSQKRAFREAI